MSAAAFLVAISGRNDKIYLNSYCAMRVSAPASYKEVPMKCLILAGGQGERLWPLSRKNYPKQEHCEKKVDPASEDLYSSPVPTTDCVTDGPQLT